MRLLFKTGAQGAYIYREHLTPEMVKILQAALDQWPSTKDGTLWVTEGHREGGGLHPRNRAFDFRTRNIPTPTSGDRRGLLKRLSGRISSQLGLGYDVVPHLELVGTPKEHLHVEWDPKET